MNKICDCGVTGAIHRRTVGFHHWKTCPMFPAPPQVQYVSPRAVKELTR